MTEIVSFSRFVPHLGIPHAGGELYRLHLLALSRLGHRVTVVAPHSDDNTRAVRLDGAPDRVLLIGTPGPQSRSRRLLVRAERRLFPSRLPARVRAEIRRNRPLADVVGSADVLEYQWLETATLLRSAVGGREDQRRIAVLHDVQSQSFSRQMDAAAPRSAQAALARWCRFISRRDEEVVLRRADAVLTLSEKDADLIDPTGSKGVLPLRPPLFVDSPPQPPRRCDAGRRILFVGAFDRTVNSEAALWLIDEVMPHVVAAVPDAVLILAGAYPTEEMLDRERTREGVVVTGRVPDLSEYYRDAAVVAVPLAAGAGVKFKTIHALLHGKPVVSTPIGIEGIASSDSGYFFAVASNASAFADGLVRALLDVDAAGSVAEAGRAWAASSFGLHDYMRRIAPLYAMRP